MKLLKIITLFLFSSLVLNTAFAGRENIIVGYYADWSGIPFTSLPVKNLTVINYAFAAPQVDGSIKLLNETVDKVNFQQISTLRKANPNLKVLLSVGGWTLSQHFSSIAADANKIKNFVASISTLLQTYPELDGIDIDWEYPVAGGDGIPHSPQDTENYVSLVKALRTQFNSFTNKHYYITIAGPHHSKQGDGGGVDYIDVKGMLNYIDWINIMDYDLHQSTSEPNNTNNDAALSQTPNNPSIYAGADSVSDSVRDYKKQGLNAAQMQRLVIGIPLYGFAWQGVNKNGREPLNPGLYSSASGKLANKYVSGSDGIFTYTTIMNHVLQESGWEAAWNAEHKFVTYFNNNTNAFLSFDDLQTVKAKAEYAQTEGLGGVMFWEISNDTFDNNSLVYQACLALKGTSCTLPTPPSTSGKMKLELSNNDPNNPITISLVTADKINYYPFPALNAASSATYTDATNDNIKNILNKNDILVLLTTSTGQQRWCAGKLDLTQGDYHHIQVYYDNVPNCAIN